MNAILQAPFDTPSASSSIELGVRSGYSGCLSRKYSYALNPLKEEKNSLTVIQAIFYIAVVLGIY